MIPEVVKSLPFNEAPIPGTYTASAPTLTEEDHAYFYKRTQLNQVTGCIDWMAGRSQNGYGLAEVGGKTMLAHRAAYLLEYGELPVGLCVLHRCDRHICVNPDHLFLGTKKQNTEDMVSKGRQRWEGNKGSRLTDIEKEVIWTRRLNGESFYAIGKILGRPQQTIKQAYLALQRKRVN